MGQTGCFWGYQFDIQTQTCVPPAQPTLPGPTSQKNLSENKCDVGMTAHPINLGTGNKFLRQEDYQANGISPLRFIRYFNSGDSDTRRFSDGWRDTYERSITTIDASTVLVTRADGKRYEAILTGTVWQFDADVHLSLVQTTSGWDLTTLSDDTESYDTTGKLIQIQTKAGRITTLAYNVAHHFAIV